MNDKIKKNSDFSTGDNIQALNANWSFGGNTAEHFDDHVRKSVPLYDLGHDLVCKLSDYYVNNNSIVYEIGTSTGSLLKKLLTHHKHKKSAKWIGIDTEENMINKATQKLSEYPNVTLEVGDVNTMELENTDLIICYYTIQFIHPSKRQDLFNKIYKSLNWGGALIMFEKVRGPDARFQDIFSTLYNDFKLQQNYSPEEIINKTRSLKGVMEPFSSTGNLGLMNRAGFVDITTVMKYLCFEGFIAIK